VTDQRRREVDDGRQREGMGEGREPRRRTRTDVHRRPRDRRRCRDAAEERHHEVRQTLPEQLTVRVVPLSDRHRVRDGRRQQRLQRTQRGHRKRGRDEGRDGVPVQECGGRTGQARWQRTDPRHGQVGRLGDDCRHTHGQ
jgi:hypothetical protein